MNKNNKKLTLLAGILLATPTIQADNSHNQHSHSGALQYTDASGKVHILQDDHQGNHHNSVQPGSQQDAYADSSYNGNGYMDTAPETYAAADAYAAQPADYAAGEQGVHGHSGPPQPAVTYYDAETGEPVPAEQVGVNYFTGKNQPYTQQPANPANPANAYSAAMQSGNSGNTANGSTQLEAGVLYVDAVTGETLTADEAQAALAYNNNTARPDANYKHAAQAQNSYTQGYAQQQPTAHNVAMPPAPPPQNAGSGYEMYANGNASMDQPSNAMPHVPQQTAAMQQAAPPAYGMQNQNTAPTPQRPLAPTRNAPVSMAAVAKAVEAGRIDILSSLQAQGADLQASDAQGLTYLHRAAAAGHLKMVKYLLRVGLNPNANTSKSWTPLHHAARFGHGNIVTTLLAAGADQHQKTVDGFSPKRLALNVNKHQVAALLR